MTQTNLIKAGKGGGGEAESNNDELSSELGSASNQKGGGNKAYTKWWMDENFNMLQKAILNARQSEISRQQHKKAFPLVPFTTLHSALKRLGSKEPTVENVFPLQKKIIE